MSRKELGQNFLINEKIAGIEAEYGIDKVVLEIGPGRGILTKMLQRVAKRVIAIEKDTGLYYNLLSDFYNSKNVRLINADFFKLSGSDVEIDKVDIIISNIPYSLSSKTIDYIIKHKIPAVLTLQKEFVDRMLAKEGSRDYSRLSVITSLNLNVKKIIDVPRGNFNPIPKVDSAVVYIEPKQEVVEYDDKYINLIMQHKRKTLRAAILNTSRNLKVSKGRVKDFINDIKENNTRVFCMSPYEIVNVTNKMKKYLE